MPASEPVPTVPEAPVPEAPTAVEPATADPAPATQPAAADAPAPDAPAPDAPAPGSAEQIMTPPDGAEVLAAYLSELAATLAVMRQALQDLSPPPAGYDLEVPALPPLPEAWMLG